MIDVVFYFQVHQPYRLAKWKPGDRIQKLSYFDDPLNKLVAERVAERCYLPMNRVLLDAIERTDGQFRCSFSLSAEIFCTKPWKKINCVLQTDHEDRNQCDQIGLFMERLSDKFSFKCCSNTLQLLGLFFKIQLLM